MKRGWLLLAGLVLVAVLSGVIGCDNHQTEESGLNLIFKYGIMARNELDTFKGTYTKDMVIDPPITVELSLTEEEMDGIYQKMVEIDFFDYPEKFSVSLPPDEPIGIVTPFASYYFKVEYNSEIKELWWDDEIISEDEKAERLRELVNFIRDIVESKQEYQELPEPRSGYL